MMSVVIAYLQDVELVVRFQRFCGLVPRPDDRRPSGPWRTQGDSPAMVHDQSRGRPDDGGRIQNGVKRRINGTKDEEEDTKEDQEEDRKEDQEEDTEEDQKEEDTANVLPVQNETKSANGGFAEDDYVVKNIFLYHLFHFGANLGNEIFYITFFPFWFWNIDGFVGRRVCIFWCFFMYTGQALKDIIKIPRPPSPPVLRLEKRYALEYGMPSTHAMVGTGIPFAIYIMTRERYNYHSEYALITAIAWSCLVCCCRIYLGMHSVLDVIAGVGIVSLMLCCLPLLDVIDDFILCSPYSPATCILVPLMLCLFYPTLKKWSTARGDTTIIMAVGAGVGLGHWLSYQYGFMQRASTLPPYDIIPPTWTWAGLAVLRMAIGVVVLVTTRAIVKLLTIRMACYVAGYDRRNSEAQKMLFVEVPYKFLTYSITAFNMVYLVPMMFRLFGIERETFFTEI